MQEYKNIKWKLYGTRTCTKIAYHEGTVMLRKKVLEDLRCTLNNKENKLNENSG